MSAKRVVAAGLAGAVFGTLSQATIRFVVHEGGASDAASGDETSATASASVAHSECDCAALAEAARAFRFAACVGMAPDLGAAEPIQTPADAPESASPRSVRADLEELVESCPELGRVHYELDCTEFPCMAVIDSPNIVGAFSCSFFESLIPFARQMPQERGSRWIVAFPPLGWPGNEQLEAQWLLRYQIRRRQLHESHPDPLLSTQR